MFGVFWGFIFLWVFILLTGVVLWVLAGLTRSMWMDWLVGDEDQYKLITKEEIENE